MRMLGAGLGLLLAASGPAPAAPACGPDTAARVDCECDLRSLRPLQGAVGLEEVRDKAARIAADPAKERRGLERDPIKLVRGPGGALYVTDHHHGARAWLLAGYGTGVCRIQAGPPAGDAAGFWDGMQREGLVHLADRDGRPIPPAALPQTLEAMPDDPYRTLAGLVRWHGGFCRALMPRTDFAEFTWADWFRTRTTELPPAEVAASAAGIEPAAMRLALSPAAREVPGWRGDHEAGWTCPKDD